METNTIEKQLPWEDASRFLPEEYELPSNFGDDTESFAYEYELLLRESLLSNLERLSGRKYYSEKVGNEEDFYPDGYWSDKSLANFISAVVAAKRGTQALNFIDYELQELTLRIKDNPLSNGRIKPLVCYTGIVTEDEEDWDGEEGLQTRYQALEIERKFREWVVDFRQALFIDLHGLGKQFPISNRGNKTPEPLKITFESIFADFDKSTKKSVHCSKLSDLLKVEEVDWVNAKGVWMGKKKELIILYNFLASEGFIKSGADLKKEGIINKNKLSQEDVCKLLSSHFAISKLDYQQFKEVQSFKDNPKAFPDILRKCNLVISLLKSA